MGGGASKKGAAERQRVRTHSLPRCSLLLNPAPVPIVLPCPAARAP